MTTETESDYETSGHESTAFEPYESEPQRFAEVHATIGGAMQFVHDAFPRAQRRIRKQNLLSMPFHHHLLYALIHDAGELPAPDLHARYDDVAGDCYYDCALEPIGQRSRRNKLQKLAEYGLIEWSGEHQHRRYRPVDNAIAPPIELQNVTNIREA